MQGPSSRNSLALFDFDGTITNRDSLIDFIRFGSGLGGLCLGLASLAPTLALYRLGAVSNQKAKEAVLARFFGGWPAERFARLAEAYSGRIPSILRGEAVERLKWHRASGHRVAVVTATLEDYMRIWCEREGLELIASRLEVRGGRITGRLQGLNCHGPEKARRIRERFRLDGFDRIYAYGDTGGDAQMLELAHERYFRWKRVG